MSAGSLFWELTRISHQGVEGRGFNPAVSGHSQSFLCLAPRAACGRKLRGVEERKR